MEEPLEMLVSGLLKPLSHAKWFEQGGRCMPRILIVVLLLATFIGCPALAVPPSGLSVACGKAYETMTACRQKFAASDAPASMKQFFDQQYAKQMADAVTMWRSMRGSEGIERSCKEIAANPTCKDLPD